MRRIAYVIGSNGPPGRALKYARIDAKRFGDCLSTECGFEVFTPGDGLSCFEIMREIKQCLAKCTPADDFLFYFSGHGSLQLGPLCLLLDDTSEKIFDSSLRISHIQDDLKYCQAGNKLVILDCLS